MDITTNKQSTDLDTQDDSLLNQATLRFKEFYESCLLNSSPFYIKLYNNRFCNTCKLPPCFIQKVNICVNLINVFHEITINDMYKGIEFSILLYSPKKNQSIAVVFNPPTKEQLSTKLRIIEMDFSTDRDFWKLDKFISTVDYTDTFSTLHNFDYNKNLYSKMFDPLRCGRTKEYFYIKKNGSMGIENYPASFLGNDSGHLYNGLAIPESIFKNIMNMIKRGDTSTCFACREYLYSPHEPKSINYCFKKSSMQRSLKGECRSFVPRC